VNRYMAKCPMHRSASIKESLSKYSVERVAGGLRRQAGSEGESTVRVLAFSASIPQNRIRARAGPVKRFPSHD